METTMGDLNELTNPKQLLDFLNKNESRANDVAERFEQMIETYMTRNDDLTRAIGELTTTGDREDEYRIDDMIELRDKIHDGFGVLEENEEYEVPDRVRATTIVGHILMALNRGQEFLQTCIDKFRDRDESQVRAEGEEIRWTIRSIDHALGEAHVMQLAAYLGVNP